MFARSWWVRRTFRTVPDPLASPKRLPRFESNVARRAETPRSRRLSITSSDCLRRSEKEKNSLEASSGRRFTASARDRKSTRLNSSHANISYAVFCLKKKKHTRVYHQLVVYIVVTHNSI